jgi:hypothetical protein
MSATVATRRMMTGVIVVTVLSLAAFGTVN